MQYTQEEQKLFDELARRMAKAGNPEKVILFGSRARGDSDHASDFDILVIEPSEQPRFKRAAKYRRALRDLRFSKDIVVWTPEEVAEWRAVPNAFITNVLREGKVLYER